MKKYDNLFYGPKVNSKSMRIVWVTSQVHGEEGRSRPWAGLLATRLDRPDFLEVETKEVLLRSSGALVDGHPEIEDWIPRDRDPSVRIREPRGHPPACRLS